MTVESLAAGLRILLEYIDDPAGAAWSAEDGRIWVLGTDRPLSPDDVRSMGALGWYQDYSASSVPYDPDGSWKLDD